MDPKFATLITHSKRPFEDFQTDRPTDVDSGPDAKRVAKPLPFRSSPGQSARLTIRPPAPSAASIWTQMPTPVESSEDEFYESNDRDIAPLQESEMNVSQTSSARSTSSVQAQFGDVGEDMEIIQSPSPCPEGTRHSPLPQRPQHPEQRHPLAPPTSFLAPSHSSERIPTPIHSTFKRDHDNHMPALAQSTRQRTALSPMIGEETAPAAHPEPLSPRGEEMDLDQDVGYHSHATELSGLALGLSGDLGFASRGRSNAVSVSPSDRADSFGLDRRHESNRNRMARLHMGFRADCEKCRQKVPGHYSHILWS